MRASRLQARRRSAAVATAAWLLASAAAHGSGLPGRPPNPDCVAFDRPLAGPNFTVEFEQHFGGNFSYTVNLIHSPLDPAVWYQQQRGVSHKPQDQGIVYRMTDDQDGTWTRTEFLDIDGELACCGEYGMLGMALHPDFATNGYVYLFYTRAPEATDPPEMLFHSVLARFTLLPGGEALDPASELPILELPQYDVHHQGGRILFGPDGYLYVALGDDYTQDQAQDPSILPGSILRIDVDAGSPYAIPPDNPFASGGGAPEVWAYGLRNPWGMHFDAQTGELYATDVGAGSYEEVNQIVGGANYGWPILEGTNCRVAPCDDLSAYTPAVVVHLHATKGGDAKAFTGVVVYRGSVFPELYGRLVYADLNGGLFTLWSEGGAPPSPLLLWTDPDPILGLTTDEAGELYVLNTNQVKRLQRGPPVANPVPTLLSQTGCFDPQDPTQPLPALVPYDVQVKLWSDGATKDRWMALPDGEQITILSGGHSDGDWDLPIGSILFKNFTLGGLLVETRLLMRHDDGGWAGYSYEWNDPPTEAVLLEGGKTRDVGGQTWTYPSRVQCLECHSAVAGRSLGPRTDQLNGPLLYPSTGLTANQIETLDHIGFLTPSPPPVSGLPALPALDDLSATLHDRARAYLQTNCAHCHQPDGLTPAELDLRFAVRSSDARMCDVVPLLDDLGVADARLVAPFDVSRSVLSLRMHDTGVFRMPPLATEIVHVEGTALIDAWIATSDEDADGVHSACDLCPTESDPSQLDTDLDSWGDACDEDDDGDGLLDAVETGTGVYVSPSDTGTDPLVTDSDGDGFPDGYEVQRGTDPTDPEDVPEVFIVPLLPGGLGLLVGALLLAAAARILRRARRRGD